MKGKATIGKTQRDVRQKVRERAGIAELERIDAASGAEADAEREARQAKEELHFQPDGIESSWPPFLRH